MLEDMNFLRVSDHGGRGRGLEVFPVPRDGYTVSYLKEVALQAKIYIRPIQQNLSVRPLTDFASVSGI